jgi:AcrR family transcriptional regulator
MNNHSLLRESRTALSQDDLLDMAGQLADDIGLERLTTGLLAERADISHDQLFRFFKDRNALVEAMIDRLYQRQTEAVNIWFGHHAALSQAQMAAHVEDLVIALFEASAGVSGSSALHQALHSQVRLAPRRKAMRSMIADRFADAVARLQPATSRDALWPRYRLAVEMALSTETLDLTTAPGRASPDPMRLAREGARVLRLALEAV